MFMSFPPSYSHLVRRRRHWPAANPNRAAGRQPLNRVFPYVLVGGWREKRAPV